MAPAVPARDDGEYEIISVVNHWTCDTFSPPDYAEFAKESCGYDSTPISSAS